MMALCSPIEGTNLVFHMSLGMGCMVAHIYVQSISETEHGEQLLGIYTRHRT
jgi:hypothetical protein